MRIFLSLFVVTVFLFSNLTSTPNEVGFAFLIIDSYNTYEKGQKKENELFLMEKSNYELKGREFLEYVAKNERKLKRNLRKNITYDPDLFDDVFQDTILKVYGAIVDNHTDIKDFEQYFYMASRFHYINTDNSRRRQQAKTERDYFSNERNEIPDDDIDQEGRFNEIIRANNTIYDALAAQFGAEDTEIFFDYYMLKSTVGCSYNDLRVKYGKSALYIGKMIRELKAYISGTDSLTALKKVLTAEY